MKIPDRLKRKPRYPRDFAIWTETFPEGQPTNNALPPFFGVASRGYLRRHPRIALLLYWARLLNWLRLFYARLTGEAKKAQWLTISRAGVSFSLPCTVPRCEKWGIWDGATGWLCKAHRDLGPRVLTEIRKAWPAVGVNGPSIFVRLPIARDERKDAWFQLFHKSFGLVELPGWIG